MSNYQESRGVFTLPTAAVSKVRGGLVDILMKKELDAYERVVAFWRKGQGKDRKYKYADLRRRDNREFDELWSLLEKVFNNSYELVGLLEKGLKPLKKDYCLTKKTQTEFGHSDLVVTFNKREVTWRVHENNHSHDDAEESIIGRTLLGLLSRVEWTRGSGGYIRYTDEYLNDSAIEHGGSATSLQCVYGPKGERAQEIENGCCFSTRRRRKTTSKR